MLLSKLRLMADKLVCACKDGSALGDVATKSSVLAVGMTLVGTGASLLMGGDALIGGSLLASGLLLVALDKADDLVD